jgi:hypothetical protein
MSHKKPLNLWKSDRPEPQDYNYHRDPLHNTDSNSGCLDRDKLIQDLTSVLKNWVGNPRIPFQAITLRLKQDWLKQGGSFAQYEQALSQAFLSSGYYKNFK